MRRAHGAQETPFPFEDQEWDEDWSGLPEGHPTPVYRSKSTLTNASITVYTVQTCICAARKSKGLTYRLADSGANACCEPNRSQFIEYEPMPYGQRFATVADGRKLPVRGVGAIQIRMPVGKCNGQGAPVWVLVKISNVLHIDFDLAIIAESKLRSMGFTIISPKRYWPGQLQAASTIWPALSNPKSNHIGLT